MGTLNHEKSSNKLLSVIQIQYLCFLLPFLLLNEKKSTETFEREREDFFRWRTFNNGERNRHGLNSITKKRFTRKKRFGSIKRIAFLKAEAFSTHLNWGPLCLWNETSRLTWHKDVNEGHLHAFDIRFECFHISFKILIYFCEFSFVDVFYFAYMFSSLKCVSFFICVSCHSWVHSVMHSTNSLFSSFFSSKQ